MRPKLNRKKNTFSLKQSDIDVIQKIALNSEIYISDVVSNVLDKFFSLRDYEEPGWYLKEFPKNKIMYESDETGYKLKINLSLRERDKQRLQFYANENGKSRSCCLGEIIRAMLP